MCVWVSKQKQWDDVNLAQRAGDTHERLTKQSISQGFITLSTCANVKHLRQIVYGRKMMVGMGTPVAFGAECD